MQNDISPSQQFCDFRLTADMAVFEIENVRIYPPPSQIIYCLGLFSQIKYLGISVDEMLF
jgi:hypothetical protein